MNVLRPTMLALFVMISLAVGPQIPQAALCAAELASGSERTAAADPSARDETLYGARREAPVIEYLSAGPIAFKFQDGELRYLHVGDKEIVRRVYFAVRDSRYDTVMPEFRKIDVQKGEGGFSITMEATCRNDLVPGYDWTGRIVGTADGRITFVVTGKAGADFESPRIGINVLYGVESLAGQGYEVIDEKGAVTALEFPRLIPNALLAESFKTLRYTSPAGMQVITTLAGERFGMEDQRTWGDSSYKAFSGLPYKYPKVAAGESGAETLTIEVRNASARAETPGALSITIGAPAEGAAMPKLLPAEQTEPGRHFTEYLGRPKRYAAADLIALTFNPAAHMPDDDTFMENVPAILDQVNTIRSFAPKARFRVALITIDSPYPRPHPDPRNRGLFAAAWCARTVKYLALAGVEEAAFKVGPGYSDLALATMAPFAGRRVLATSVGPHAAIDALAVDDAGRRVVWLINKTDQPQEGVSVEFGRPAKVQLQRLNASTSLKAGLEPPTEMTLKDGSLKLSLGPFEVCILTEVR